METPKELDRQVHRIHELLEQSDAKVTWNERIPDPDNLPQLRQIDNTVRRDGKLTAIECRLSSSRQDVQWIEELIGRRLSLGVDTIIAVASVGFTKGAQLKAARYGVLLRDLKHLTEEEVANWGNQVALILYYYQYSDVNVSVGFAAQSFKNIDPVILVEELRRHAVLQSVFNAASSQLDTLKLLAREDTRTIRFGVRVAPELVDLCGERVLEIGLEGKARLIAQSISSPRVLGYGEPAQVATERPATVEQFELGETSIVHNNDRIAIEIDLAGAALPPLSQIRYFRTAHENLLNCESLAITSPEMLRVSNGRLTLDLYEIQR
jgi:hypothetical protein